jgi:DNA-binding transcriptional regulator YdaS (Cro superfamily)
MRLSEYLDREGTTYVAFAERIGASHARTVERYAKGMRMPDATMMPRIVEATGGEVTPNDFFGVSGTAEAA